MRKMRLKNSNIEPSRRQEIVICKSCTGFEFGLVFLQCEHLIGLGKWLLADFQVKWVLQKSSNRGFPSILLLFHETCKCVPLMEWYFPKTIVIFSKQYEVV